MYTLYTDKSEDFKCNIKVDGANISNTTARLVLENSNLNILFEGTIDSNGICIVPIKQLKNILPEGIEGKMKLEVIADGTFFSPWEDDFIIKVNKKVTVEVKNDTSINTIKEDIVNVKVTNIIKQKPITNKITTKSTHRTVMEAILQKKGITLTNFSEDIHTSKPLIEAYIKKYHIKQSAEDMLNEIIINLK
jgi:hypothetical protein